MGLNPKTGNELLGGLLIAEYSGLIYDWLMHAMLAIIQTDDADAALERLKPLNLPSVSQVASQGSFLRQGNTTLWLAVPDDQLESVLTILRATCHRRAHYMPVQFESAHLASAFPVEVEVGGATVFLSAVERFEVL